VRIYLCDREGNGSSLDRVCRWQPSNRVLQDRSRLYEPAVYTLRASNNVTTQCMCCISVIAIINVNSPDAFLYKSYTDPNRLLNIGGESRQIKDFPLLPRKTTLRRLSRTFHGRLRYKRETRERRSAGRSTSRRSCSRNRYEKLSHLFCNK
jgi:hypothetical protein